MLEGRIVKALSGFYYVMPEAGSATVQCRARGLFKKKGVSPLVGDRVVYEATSNGEGTVVEVLPRSSELVRPPVSNVDLAVLVFSLVEPALNLQLLDKMLVHAEWAGIEAAIIFSKYDLYLQQEEPGFELAPLVRLYEDLGCRPLLASSKTGLGVEEAAARLNGRISVFAGQSGVGKSSLLNAIVPGLRMETGAVSEKLGRGKHTTRHVELVSLAGGGLVADTPGFSQLDFEGLEPEQLGPCFKDIAALSEGCKFRGCLHQQEPGCMVMEAADSGRLPASRYNHYLQFLGEMKERKRRY